MPDGEYEVRYHPLFHVDVVSVPIGVLLLITVCGTGRFPDFHSSSSTTFESLRFLFLV